MPHRRSAAAADATGVSVSPTTIGALEQKARGTIGGREATISGRLRSPGETAGGRKFRAAAAAVGAKSPAERVGAKFVDDRLSAVKTSRKLFEALQETEPGKNSMAFSTLRAIAEILPGDSGELAMEIAGVPPPGKGFAELINPENTLVFARQHMSRLFGRAENFITKVFANPTRAAELKLIDPSIKEVGGSIQFSKFKQAEIESAFKSFPETPEKFTGFSNVNDFRGTTLDKVEFNRGLPMPVEKIMMSSNSGVISQPIAAAKKVVAGNIEDMASALREGGPRVKDLTDLVRDEIPLRQKHLRSLEQAEKRVLNTLGDLKRKLALGPADVAVKKDITNRISESTGHLNFNLKQQGDLTAYIQSTEAFMASLKERAPGMWQEIMDAVEQGAKREASIAARSFDNYPLTRAEATSWISLRQAGPNMEVRSAAETRLAELSDAAIIELRENMISHGAQIPSGTAGSNLDIGRALQARPSAVNAVPYSAARLRAISEPLGREVNIIIESADNLGFDTRGEGLTAIIQHSDWEQRWDVSDLPVEQVNSLHEFRRRWLDEYGTDLGGGSAAGQSSAGAAVGAEGGGNRFMITEGRGRANAEAQRELDIESSRQALEDLGVDEWERDNLSEIIPLFIADHNINEQQALDLFGRLSRELRPGADELGEDWADRLLVAANEELAGSVNLLDSQAGDFADLNTLAPGVRADLVAADTPRAADGETLEERIARMTQRVENSGLGDAAEAGPRSLAQPVDVSLEASEIVDAAGVTRGVESTSDISRELSNLFTELEQRFVLTDAEKVTLKTDVMEAWNAGTDSKEAMLAAVRNMISRGE